MAKLLQDAVEHVEYPLFVCEAQRRAQGKTPTLRVLFANPASKPVTGLDSSEVLTKDLFSLLAPKPGAPLRDRLDDAVRSGGPATIGAIRCKVGRGTREFELAAVPLGKAGNHTTHWAFVLRDVTAQQQRGRRVDELEEIVAGQAAELKTSQEELQRSERMATLGTLVSGLGHDLNNLLLPIRGHLQALEASALDDTAQMHVQAVGQAVDYLQQLNDNLRLSALDPEGPSDACGVTEIGAWWGRLREMLTRAITAPVRLRVDLPGDLPAVGVAPHRLTQAVLNLLINASEAITGAGTVRLWAENSDDHECVRIGVTDNGRGMTSEVQQRVFDPFFTTKQRRRATGLGLSLVHGIVHSAGGTVEIESAPRRGTTIILNVPVAPSDAVTHAALGRDEPASAAVSLRDRRVAACFKALLASAGFVVRPAPTRNPTHVDLWVTEPSPSSLRAARKLRAANPDCRIVVFGRASDDWLALKALTVDREGSLSTMREALAHAISARQKDR
ncbi:MAG: PAS domain-containing protein [Phycisphaerae bacterium]|nr:PAS domain-containing protein [Phycisphaerae bacterium]